MASCDRTHFATYPKLAADDRTLQINPRRHTPLPIPTEKKTAVARNSKSHVCAHNCDALTLHADDV